MAVKKGIILGTLTKRSTQLLRMLYEKGKATNTYSLCMKQDDLAKQLGISRQALNVHLRKLRNLDYIRTGRGFIDVTEKGLNALGISSKPAFIFVKVSPRKRDEAYEKIKQLTIRRAFRIMGDADVFIMVEGTKLDEILNDLSYIEGVENTKSYMTI